MNNDQYAVSALDELKNNTLLLTTANEHLVDEVFLVKIGNNISHVVEVLERDISALKKEYPGKFVNDVDTDSILEKIDHAAQRMLKPSKEIKDNHASGALGREMEANFTSIRKAVEDIRIKVRGTHTQNPGKGSATDILNSFKEVFQSAGGILISGAKILAGLIFIAGVAFAYLYFTMEKDTVFMNKIAASSALIQEKKGQIPGLEQERQALNDKKNSMKSGKEMTREEKVAVLEFEVGVKKINDTIDQLEAEIAVQEKKIADNQDKLDEFRKKTFFNKLLKR
jgi:hypothetical protein